MRGGTRMLKPIEARSFRLYYYRSVPVVTIIRTRAIFGFTVSQT
jgi:hypothetical protein